VASISSAVTCVFREGERWLHAIVHAGAALRRYDRRQMCMKVTLGGQKWLCYVQICQ
jgi:hypothetical protein